MKEIQIIIVQIVTFKVNKHKFFFDIKLIQEDYFLIYHRFKSHSSYVKESNAVYFNFF